MIVFATMLLAEIVVAAMLDAAKAILKTVPVKVDAYISDTWRKG